MRNKYGARKVEADGYTFASMAEHRRYEELRMLLLAGEITDLEIHPGFTLYAPVNEGHDFSRSGYMRCRVKEVGKYHADFAYLTKKGIPVVEEVKSKATVKNAAYRLRKKIVESCYGIKITEVLR